MNWADIKRLLIGGTFDMKIAGAFGKSKTVTLTMTSAATLTFSTLGTGSMKRVVRVNNENWVLALAGDSPGAQQDMEGEVSTLCALAASGIRVPEPFASAIQRDILFNLPVFNTDMGDEIDYPAFLQQFLPFTEMDKLQPKSDFAKMKIVFNGKIPMHIQTTVDDLTRILAYFKTKGEWGDFQVMYNPLNGQVFVFDPLPKNSSGESFTKLVERWLTDIKDVRDAERMRLNRGRSKSF